MSEIENVKENKPTELQIKIISLMINPEETLKNKIITRKMYIIKKNKKYGADMWNHAQESTTKL